MSEKQQDTSPASTTPRQAASRPKFSDRAGVQGKQRLRRERHVRGLEADKDETALAGFFFTCLIYAIRLTLIMLGIYRRGILNARQIQVVHRDIAIHGLPEALEGFRILHISDFHFPRRFPKFAETIGKILDGLEIDLCCVTGDYRYGYFGPADHIAPHLHTALQGVHSQHGVYAVLGNHDRLYTGELLEASGVPVLFNEGILLDHNDQPLWICGIDETHFYKCDDIDAALQDRPENAFSILLSHSPEDTQKAAAKGVSLYLAGHTHGGQIRLPFIGALIYNAHCNRNQVWGVWHINTMAGHTTAGIGATDVPVRYNCPPEAAVLTLKRASGT